MSNQKSYAFSIFVIGSLFFVLGFVTWLNAILMPFLQEACELTTFQSSFVPFAFYISYFVTAIPSSMVLKKTGFSNGMSLALIVMAFGALIFIPAAITRNYLLFLIGLFVQGVGLSLLQTAVNPYATILGPIESAARRISIMGICNKVAGMIGIFLLSKVLFIGSDELVESLATITDMVEREQILQTLSNRVMAPYSIMAVILFGLVIFIRAAKLPEINEEEDLEESVKSRKSIFAYPYLWLGVFAIFFYVGAEVIAIDYLARFGAFLGFTTEVSNSLSIYALIALVVGYLLGIALVPKFISQRKALIIQLLLATMLVFVAIFTTRWIAAISIILLSFAHAIMWPAIWPLSIHNLGKYTKLGSALLVMAIAGGAIMPLIYGKMSDIYNPQNAYTILFVCYAYIFFFAAVGYKIGKK
ncbi:MAG: sugar MFS transporter [Lentimicrobiaceae bacterium]|jgi:glucose/galactose transporter|nr:sugar MFS transporter [Lentimicrobiaceae bacterium]